MSPHGGKINVASRFGFAPAFRPPATSRNWPASHRPMMDPRSGSPGPEPRSDSEAGARRRSYVSRSQRRTRRRQRRDDALTGRWPVGSGILLRPLDAGAAPLLYLRPSSKRARPPPSLSPAIPSFLLPARLASALSLLPRAVPRSVGAVPFHSHFSGYSHPIVISEV